ncbi:MAG: pafC [Ilumatobacteraceae bacterium]|nr:pafC [Ilumatobacteraceae bacterium]
MSARRGPRPLSVRLRRLLVMLPWLMERGSATVAEMSERFQVSEKDLITDLEQAAMCGLPPFVDEFIDLFIDDGVVTVGVPRFFTRPLRLTAPEGFALLMAGRAALALPGADTSGPLARALDKLEGVLGGDAMVLDLAQPPAAAALVAAIQQHATVAITYWSGSSGSSTQRVISPRAVFADRGRWYVVADDDRSGEERTFRIDRITDWASTGQAAAVTDDVVRTGGGDAWFDELDDLPVVTLRLRPAGRWVVERYPVRSVTVDGEDTIAQLAIVSEAWLRDLVLQLGTDADVVDPPMWRDLAAETARRLLATRYAAGA